MTVLDDCLAAFAVTSWAKRSADLATIRRAIQAYLENVDADPASQSRALWRLFAACDELTLDSRVAIVIKDEIAGRIRGLRAGFGATAACVAAEQRN